MANQQTYRVKDLAGCLVVTTQGEILGVLRDVLPTGSNDVFVVGEGAAEILVPALKTVVHEIDLQSRRITVDLPAGLRPEERP